MAKQFKGYIENEYLDMRANLKCLTPIKKCELKNFPTSTVLYIFDKTTGYPDIHIETYLN